MKDYEKDFEDDNEDEFSDKEFGFFEAGKDSDDAIKTLKQEGKQFYEDEGDELEDDAEEDEPEETVENENNSGEDDEEAEVDEVKSKEKDEDFEEEDEDDSDNSDDADEAGAEDEDLDAGDDEDVDNNEDDEQTEDEENGETEEQDNELDDEPSEEDDADLDEEENEQQAADDVADDEEQAEVNDGEGDEETSEVEDTTEEDEVVLEEEKETSEASEQADEIVEQNVTINSAQNGKGSDKTVDEDAGDEVQSEQEESVFEAAGEENVSETENSDSSSEEAAEENVTEHVIDEVEEEVDEAMVEETKVKRKSTAASYDSESSGGSGDDGDYILKTIDEVMHESMIPYSEFVILDRALPRVEDGLKPVQRRILYAMYELGLEPDKPFRKSAGIVGETMGKYHPHGDKSIYDAMVRLAQPFNMNMPVVTGQGNFGSDDGDPAAAMRYTEARLAPLALELLRDIDKQTVPFSLTFDDRNTEPDILPGRFPNLLVNGATGIAVGLATNIPPHNLGEVIDAVIAVIDSPKITLKEVMKYIKGPDFPTSAYIIAGPDLIQAYETGRGKVIMRAKVHIEIADNGSKSIIIQDLPYQINKVSLQQRIALLREEKKGALVGIGEIRDESDKKGTRIVIRIKKEADPKVICDLLFKYTDLQCNFNINIVAIAEGKPLQMGLLQILHYYVAYQRDIILKRSKYDLEAAKEKAHILEGLLIAIKNIDEVVKIIKTSKNTPEAKQRLKDRFKLSDRQAQAILDLRLARLTSLEVYKLEEELKELHALIKKLEAIINSKKLQYDVVKQEILEIKKKFRVDRRSRIITNVEQAVITADDDAVPVTDVVIAYSNSGNLKSIPLKSFNLSQTGFNDKTGINEVNNILVQTQSDKLLYIFTNLGNCYKLDAGAIPDGKWKDKGAAFKSLIKESVDGEKIVNIFALDGETLPTGDLIFLTKQGMIKKSKWSEYGIIKSAFQAVKVNDGDEVINLVQDQADTTILFVTHGGMVLNALKDDVPYQGRVAAGVRGINLSDKDYCVFAGFATKNGAITVIDQTGIGKVVKVSEVEPMARYRKGLKISNNNVLFSEFNSEDATYIGINASGDISGVEKKNIANDTRIGKGKQIKNFSNKTVSIVKYLNKL